MHRETPPLHPEIEEEYDAQPSKTRRKQEMHDLQALGEQLVGINNERLRQLTLTDNLLAAIIEAKRITTHGARRRQMQYIGKLMRTIDAAPIQAKLDEWNGASRAQNAKFHQLNCGANACWPTTKCSANWRASVPPPISRKSAP
jgi:ribosome-associated protein